MMAQMGLAIKYRAAGQFRQSLDVLEHVKATAEKQRQRTRQDAVVLNALSYVYEQMYQSNLDFGDVESALSAGMACLEISKQWAAVDSANSDALSRVASAYTIIGDAERRLKKLNEAREAVSSGLEIRKKLDPNNKRYRSDLATSWLRLADVFSDQEDHVGTLDASQHALDISKKLVEDDSSNVQWKKDLAGSYCYVGSALRRLLRPAEARPAYEAALAIRQDLAKAAPDDRGLSEEVIWTTDRIRELDRK